MEENGFADDPRLLSVASTIASGRAVDWGAVDPDPETTVLLNELRALEGLCRAAQPIPDTWGPFTISGELGHGSYGTVYRAFDANLNLEVALKVIRPLDTADTETCATALAEARLLAQVNQPNVVRVFSAERIGDEVGIAMELVRGQTLHRIVREQGPLSAAEAMLVGIDLCRAVAAVHDARLLHGDIKANNVMRAQGGRTVLMDFGAGHDLKAAGDGGRRTIGTPIYLAPEVLAGGAATRASDIYSLGVLLFYLVTGTHPVHGDTRTDVLRYHAPDATRRRLLDLRPGLPVPFAQIVERATSASPEDRYGSAGEMQAALESALRGEDRAAPPAAHGRRLRPVAIAAALTVTVLGAGYQSWQYLSSGNGSPPTAPAVVDPPPAAPAATTAAPVAGAYQIEATFYRHEGQAPVRLRPGTRVAPGDLLSLEVRSSVPTYVYVVNEDDQGESFLLFPLAGQQRTNPLPPGERHEIPGIVDGERVTWKVSSSGGREHFLVFATPDPPAADLERLFAGLDRPSMGGPVLAQKLPNDLVTALRGVGGLAKAPARPSRGRLSDAYSVPLPDRAETASGVWVRQLTLENPGK